MRLEFARLENLPAATICTIAVDDVSAGNAGAGVSADLSTEDNYVNDDVAGDVTRSWAVSVERCDWSPSPALGSFVHPR